MIFVRRRNYQIYFALLIYCRKYEKTVSFEFNVTKFNFNEKYCNPQENVKFKLKFY